MRLRLSLSLRLKWKVWGGGCNMGASLKAGGHMFEAFSRPSAAKPRLTLFRGEAALGPST
jgi:hypothetical protein